MIVLGNYEFAIGMKLAGLKESYQITSRDDAINILKNLPNKEFIIANVSVFRMVPELENFPNAVSMPDDASEFLSTQDLQNIVRSAVGVELNLK